MARKTDLRKRPTSETIDEKDAATVTVKYADARRGQVVLDVNADEVAASRTENEAGPPRAQAEGLEEDPRRLFVRASSEC
jgi:hypothetical protein